MKTLSQLKLIAFALSLTLVLVFALPAQAQAQCYVWWNLENCQQECRPTDCPTEDEPANLQDSIGTSCATAPKPSLPDACNLNTADGVTKSDFDAFNPLKVGNDGGPSPYADQLSTPGGIVTRLLEFAFPLAGMILFVMLLWGGFEMIYGASTTSKAVEAGKNRVTTAVIGFFLLFASYWIVQILEVVLGIKVL